MKIERKSTLGSSFSKFARSQLVLVFFTLISTIPIYPNAPSQIKESPQEAKRVLILIGPQYGLATIDLLLPPMMDVLKANGLSLDQLYVEFLDVHRNSEPRYLRALGSMLEQKYMNAQPGVIIAVSQGAVDFMAREGATLFGDAPMLILERHPIFSDQSRKAITFIAKQDIEGTVNYALSIYPKTNRIVVIMGPDDSRSPFLDPLLAAIEALPNQPIVETTADLPYDEMLSKLAALDSGTIAFYGSYFQDLTGRSFVPAEVASQIGKVARIPVFAFLDSHISAGLSGGSVAISAEIARLAARTAVEYLEGSLPLEADLTNFDIPSQGIFNYPSLRRTGASMAKLPPGAIVLNRPVTIWEQYRELVLVAGISLLMLLGLSIGLAVKSLQQRSAIERLRSAEAALRSSEEKHRRLFETMSQGVIYQDADGRITSANPAAERMVGLSFDQMSGKTSMDPRWKMIDEGGRQLTGAEHPAMLALRSGVKVGPVIRGIFVPESDDYVWLSIIATPLFKDGEDTAHQCYAAFDDVTQIKRQEKAIEDQRRLLDTIVNHLPAGVSVLSGDDFRIVLANLAYRAFAPGKEIIGLSVDELWSETGQDFNQICRQVLETGIPFSGQDQLIMGRRRLDSPLEERYFSWHLHRIALPDNKGWGLLKTAWDTTEIVKANLRLKRIINTDNIGVMFWNFVKGSMVEANDTFLSWTGYDRADLADGSLTWQRLTPEEYHAVSLAEMEKLNRTGKVGPYEKEYNCKDGSRKWMLFAGSAIDGDECVEFCIDISDLKRAEEELRKKDRLISKMGRVASIGGWEYAADTHTMSWTDETFRIHGLASGGGLDAELGLGLYPPASRERLQEGLMNSLRNEEAIEISIPFVTAQGEERWVTIIGEPLVLDGRTQGVAGSWQDITERRKAEIELRESEEKFRALFYDPSIIKLLIDPATGSIIDANQAAAVFYGWTVNQLKTMNIGQFDARAPETLREQVRSVRSSEKKIFTLDHRKSDGSIAAVQIFSSLLNIKNKEILHFIVYDVSEKIETERRIRLLSRAVESSSAAIMITDAQGAIEYVNPHFCIMTGFTIDEATGSNPRILKSGTHSAEYYERIWAKLAAGEEWTGEFQNRKKNGELYWESAIISPVFDESGDITNYVAVKEDITERKRIMDQLEKTIGIKEKLVQELSHRSYNIMQIMQGLLSFKAHNKPDVSLERFANDVSDQIQAMSLAYREIQDGGNLSRINLESFIMNLTHSVIARDHGLSKTSVSFNLDEIYILIDSAIPLGLVLNDLLTVLVRNRFSEGTASMRDLSLGISASLAETGEVDIRITDNGRPDGTLGDNSAKSQDGIDLAFALSEQQLGGTLEIGDGLESRWVFRLCFKNDLYEERV